MENDEYFTPSDQSAGGKGWIGDKVYSINQTDMLPPLHPNCRCVAYFTKKDTINSEPKETNENKTIEPTAQQLQKNLTKNELVEYKKLKKTIDWAKNVQESKFIKDEGKQKALEQLKILTPRFNESKNKALGILKNQKLSKSTLDKPKNSILTKKELDKISFNELAEHHEAKYNGIKTYDYDGKKYHVFEQTFDDGRVLTLRFEEGTVKSYTKKGIATPNEIIHEVFKVPETLRIETREIWFKNTQHGIQHTYNKSGYDTLGVDVGGYNLPVRPITRNFKEYDDYNHRIVINPNISKEGVMASMLPYGNMILMTQEIGK